MRTALLLTLVCIMGALVACPGCEKPVPQGSGDASPGDMVFINDHQSRVGVVVFPVLNGTGKVCHPYRSNILGLNILSVHADGKSVPPVPCTPSFPNPLDARTMEMGPGGCFAYTDILEELELVCAKTISMKDGKHEYVRYVIPESTSILVVRYAVRDAITGAAFCEDTATFSSPPFRQVSRAGLRRAPDNMVFLSHQWCGSPLVLPVFNGTGRVCHPYQSSFWGLNILSVQVDGKPIAQEPGEFSFQSEPTYEKFEMGPGQSFAYTSGELLFVKPASEKGGESKFLQYDIPSFSSSVVIRYEVRDGVSGGTFYEGTATFAPWFPIPPVKTDPQKTSPLPGN
jgi:hypothetical protein